MQATSRAKYNQLVQMLVEQRKSAGINQNVLGDRLGIDQSNVSRYERRELQLDIDLLARWCEGIDVSLEGMLRSAGYIEPTSTETPRTARPVLGNNETAYPVRADETADGFNLILQWRDQHFAIPFPGSDINRFRVIETAVSDLFSSLNNKRNSRSNRDAIAEALLLAISQMPEANPSDIYHHVVYRLYLREYNRTDPKQSWVRAGGEAVELFFKRHYTPRLAPHGISIHLAFEMREKNKFLTEMGLADQIAGGSKLDICLYGTCNRGLVPFAGVHSKASLAERVSDDKPCSERMMAAGFKSYLFTFDAKSFPPPTGDLVNQGELGTILRPSDKRGYIEQHGSFDACFSYNTRTTPSGQHTASGKKIFTSHFDNADSLISQVTADWQAWKRTRGL